MPIPRKKAKAEEESADSWIMSYGDMMSLLLTFFVLIVSFSTVELIKFRKAMGALRGASGAMVAEEGNAIVQVLPSMMSTRAIPNEELKQVLKDIEQTAFEYGDGQDISIELTKEGIRFRIANLVMFESGQATLIATSFKILDPIARLIKSLGCAVSIEGHTDNIPIHSLRFPSNWELSAIRAVSVLRYFVEQRGVDPTKVMAVGYGEFKPIALNEIPKERALNRRVEISLKWPELTGKQLLQSRTKQ